MSMITIDRLSRRYGNRIGVEDITLTIEKGEVFGFLGPNGAGKSTTIRLLMGFLRPTRGRATMLGHDVWRASQLIKRDVGYLPGDLRLYPWLTGRTALEISAKIRGIDLTDRGGALAERFQMEMRLPVRKMSRGTRQKLGILLALAHDPQLLVLDEPTSGLDPLMQDELARCLRERATRGDTVFFSSHSLSEVENLCDRVAIVRRGQLVADETLESLRRRARRRVRLVFAERAAKPQLPGFLTVLRSEERLSECELTGPTGPLIAWAAAQPVDDISISPPDLETLFRQYYDSERESD